MIPVRTTRDPAGNAVEFPDEPGLAPFVESALSGADYPPVFPDVFRPEVIVDIGAHVGSAALFFRRTYPEARILSFEPNPVSFEFLARNVAGQPGIEIQQIAVGDEEAEMGLFSGTWSSMQASLVPSEETRAASTLVRVRPAGAVLREAGVTRISVLKVDTEGMEIPILRALEGDLGTTDVVHLEYHSERDRRALDALLCRTHVLFAAHATEPDRGNLTYARAASLAAWQAATQLPRYTFPKPSPRSPAGAPDATKMAHASAR